MKSNIILCDKIPCPTCGEFIGSNIRKCANEGAIDMIGILVCPYCYDTVEFIKISPEEIRRLSGTRAKPFVLLCTTIVT